MDSDPTLPSAFEHEAITGPIDTADPLRYRRWPPAQGTTPRATLAVLSGIMSNTAWFRPLAVRWQAMGYHVLGVERRGSGLNSAQGPGDTESAERLLDDAAAVIAHGRAAQVPLVIVGWCWGAILGVHLALRLPDTAGLALLTPGLFPSARVTELMQASLQAAEGQRPEAPVLLSPITDEMFTDGPALDAFIRRDEARWRRFSPRFLQISTRMSMMARMRLRKLGMPVFAAFAQDDVTSDDARMRAELARLPPQRVQTVSLPGCHGLQFDAPDALTERLDAWAHDALGV